MPLMNVVSSHQFSHRMDTDSCHGGTSIDQPDFYAVFFLNWKVLEGKALSVVNVFLLLSHHHGSKHLVYIHVCQPKHNTLLWQWKASKQFPKLEVSLLLFPTIISNRYVCTSLALLLMLLNNKRPPY